MSHSGMLSFSSRPIEFYLPRRLNGVRFTTLRLRSVDKCAVPPGFAELSSYIPYSAKFSRRIIFAGLGPRKLSSRIFSILVASAQRLSLDSELLYRHANVEHTLDIFFGT